MLRCPTGPRGAQTRAHVAGCQPDVARAQRSTGHTAPTAKKCRTRRIPTGSRLRQPRDTQHSYKRLPSRASQFAARQPKQERQHCSFRVPRRHWLTEIATRQAMCGIGHGAPRTAEKRGPQRISFGWGAKKQVPAGLYSGSAELRRALEVTVSWQKNDDGLALRNW